MQPSLHYPSKKKIFGLLAGSSAFVVVGVFVQLYNHSNMSAPIIFFGIFSAIFLLNLLPQSTSLKTDKEGFTFTAFFRKSFFRWEEVSGFRVTMAVTSKVVTFDYTAPTDTDSVFSTREHFLPMAIGFPPETLVELFKIAKNESFGA